MNREGEKWVGRGNERGKRRGWCPGKSHGGSEREGDGEGLKEKGRGMKETGRGKGGERERMKGRGSVGVFR